MEKGIRLTMEEAMLNLLQEVYGIYELPQTRDKHANERAAEAKRRAFESAKKGHWCIP